MIAAKGFVAVDGVSLTVAAPGDGWFEIALIPETLARTTLGDARRCRVNLEADPIARYSSLQCSRAQARSAGVEGSRMSKFRDTLPPNARVFEARLQVQWADVDVAGIMYFAAYSRFAEYAEMQLFAELGFPYESVFDEYGFWLPRVHVEADYHAPALMSDWLRMRTHIEHVGASSVRWQTVFFNERTERAGGGDDVYCRRDRRGSMKRSRAASGARFDRR